MGTSVIRCVGLKKKMSKTMITKLLSRETDGGEAGAAGRERVFLLRG